MFLCNQIMDYLFFFFFSSRRRHTRLQGDWSSDVCSSDLEAPLSRLSSASTVSSGTFSARTESWSLRYATIGGDPSAPAHAELGRSAAAARSTIAAAALHAIV